MMPAAGFPKARATVLVNDLLAGFTTEAVQQKLDREVCRKDSSRYGQSLVKDNLQGKDDSKVATQTASNASLGSLGKCTSVKSKGAEAEESPPTTIQRMACARVNEKIAKQEGQAVEDSNQLTDSAGQRTSLSKTQALSLQTELLKAFTAPAFQKKLHELVRLHNAAATRSPAYRVAFQKIVRIEQIPIFKGYGFKASEEGVVDVLQEFERFGDDADIFVNSEAIKEALFSPFTPAPSVEPQGNWFLKPTSKGGIFELLRCLHQSYSRPEFQADVHRLLKSEAGARCAAAGYYHLPGRAELAVPIQETVLPHYGFEASSKGVHEMIVLCAPYLMDPDIVGLFDAINGKLGMEPAACERFRKLVIDLSGEKQSLFLPAQCRPFELYEPIHEPVEAVMSAVVVR